MAEPPPPAAAAAAGGGGAALSLLRASNDALEAENSALRSYAARLLVR